jgi:predicted dehydrogenase
MVSNHALGDANYRTAVATSRQLQLPLRYIHALDDVQMWANGPAAPERMYTVRPVAIAGGLVTYRVYSTNRAAASGALLDHAVHTHTITTLAVGGGVAVTVKNLALDDGAGAVGVTGIDNAAAMAHANAAAALKDIAALEEIQDGTDLSAVTIYGQAVGY